MEPFCRDPRLDEKQNTALEAACTRRFTSDGLSTVCSCDLCILTRLGAGGAMSRRLTPALATPPSEGGHRPNSSSGLWDVNWPPNRPPLAHGRRLVEEVQVTLVNILLKDVLFSISSIEPSPLHSGSQTFCILPRQIYKRIHKTNIHTHTHTHTHTLTQLSSFEVVAISEHVTSDLVVAVVQIPSLPSADLGSVSVQLGFFAVISVLVCCLFCAAHTRYQCNPMHVVLSFSSGDFLNIPSCPVFVDML
jgi:hypothetical protein